jgi:argininosuccinate lyase
VTLADSFCTGSSIMPQKKNPDIPELIRGKSGRVVGNLMSLLMLLKGLPMTYNRDLQEDKEPLFDTVDTVSQSVAIMAQLLANLTFNEARLARGLGGGYMTATDLADYLVLKNIPFRQAHAIVGRTVAYAIGRGKELPELTVKELRKFSEVIEADVFKVLSIEGSVKSRVSLGGTSGKMVAKALKRAEKELGITA